MKVDEIYARMSVIILKAGLNAVGLAGRCWMMKEVNDKLKERAEVR